RLEAEEAEHGQSLPKMERALVYVDDSANGRLAARLAGLFAARQQVLTTVLDVTREQHAERQPHHEHVAEAARSAEQGIPAVVTARPGHHEDALHRELRHGYDIVFVGLADPVDVASHRFAPRLQELVDT